MARCIAYLLLLTVASCMEMKETVERMVMVRTTGMDQQPAATGFIYKRDSDGPAKVLKMGESEIMQHLKKLPASASTYDKLTSFPAPLPANGPFHTKEQDENKAASESDQAYIIPIIEKPEDDHKIPGIAEDDYEKFLGEYASDFSDYKGFGYSDDPGFYKSDFDDYLHRLGRHHLPLHHDHNNYGGGSDFDSEGNSAHGDKGFAGYASKHHYGKGGAGDYHNENHESFAVSKGGALDKGFSGDGVFGDAFTKSHGITDNNHGYKSGHSKAEETDGYHNIFEKDEFKKDHGFYDGEGNEGGFGVFANGEKGGGSASGGFAEGGAGDAGFQEAGFGKGGFHDHGVDEQQGSDHNAVDASDSTHHHNADFATKLENYGGKGFGYHIKHR